MISNAQWSRRLTKAASKERKLIAAYLQHMYDVGALATRVFTESRPQIPVKELAAQLDMTIQWVHDLVLMVRAVSKEDLADFVLAGWSYRMVSELSKLKTRDYKRIKKKYTRISQANWLEAMTEIRDAERKEPVCIIPASKHKKRGKKKK